MKNVKKILSEAEVYIGTILLISMFLLLNVQVLSRYLLKHALTWTEELSTVMFVWLGYLGASAAVYKQQHLRIDIILNMFHGRAKKIMIIITDLITMAFCLAMVSPMVDVINHLAKLRSTTLILRMPMNLIYWVLPFALVLQALRFVQEIVRIVKAPPEEEASVVGKTIFDSEEDEE